MKDNAKDNMKDKNKKEIRGEWIATNELRFIQKVLNKEKEFNVIDIIKIPVDIYVANFVNVNLQDYADRDYGDWDWNRDWGYGNSYGECEIYNSYDNYYSNNEMIALHIAVETGFDKNTKAFYDLKEVKEWLHNGWGISIE